MKETLKDYMLEGGVKNRAFISNKGEVYVVKGFRFYQGRHKIENIPLIDADLITTGNHRKRTGLALGGVRDSHLYDKKATFSDIRKALSRVEQA